MRPSLDIEQVATGEHWYGQQAVEKGLVDEINTSDEVILSLMEGREVVNVRYMQRKRLIDRLTGSAARAPKSIVATLVAAGSKAIDVKDKREAKTSRFALINQMIFF